MKLHMKPKAKKPEEKRKSTETPDSILISFFALKTQKAEMQNLIEKAKELVKPKLTQAFLLREGLDMALAKYTQMIAKAEKGELHAKKRKSLK